MAITHKKLGYNDRDDDRGGHTPNPKGTSRTSFQQSVGNLSLTYHLQIQIRLNLSRGAKTRLFAKLKEPEHAADFYAANGRFQAAAQTLVGQRFNAGADAMKGLRSAVDPVVDTVFRESWRDRDNSGDHIPIDFETGRRLDPNE